MKRPTELFYDARRIYHVGGMIHLLRRTVAFIGYCLFQHRRYWLYSEPVPGYPDLTEADFLPRIDGLTWKAVSSNEEADELEAQGLEFRSLVPNARERLKRGAVALCIFVGRELANMGWLVTGQRAMDSLPDPPLKVDFANNEACGGAIWTSPKYRRNGFRLYNRYKRFEFLVEKGFVVNRSAIAKKNVVAQSGYRRFPPTRTYAEGRYLRVLWWRSWKESPLAA